MTLAGLQLLQSVYNIETAAWLCVSLLGVIAGCSVLRTIIEIYYYRKSKEL